MGIGKRLKEAREKAGLTQEELGKRIGVTGSAITNYEKETSHPKESIMYALMDALQVEPNFLFQDCINSLKDGKKDNFSEEEVIHIKKYRALDKHGKEMVDIVLDKETERVVAEQQARLAELKAQQEQLEAAEEIAPEQEAPIPVTEDGLEDSPEYLMKYVNRLSSGQKQAILDQVRKMIKPQKESLPASAPLEADNKGPKIERQVQP